MPNHPTRLRLGDINPSPGSSVPGAVVTLQEDGTLAMAISASSGFQNLTLTSSGSAGDAIVFDTGASPGAGASSFRTLASSPGYIFEQTFIVGWLTEAATANVPALVSFGGPLPPSITGLTGGDAGRLTVDLTTGRLRSIASGDPTFGYCDASGNAFLLYGVLQ